MNQIYWTVEFNITKDRLLSFLCWKCNIFELVGCMYVVIMTIGIPFTVC